MEQKELEKILYHDGKGPKLDSLQIKILLDNSKQIAVIAAAGSGKTMTMIAKVIYLIKYKKVRPTQILVLAFTNAAVLEFKERLEKLGYFGVSIFTFHKLASAILSVDNYDGYQIADGYEYFNTIVDSLYQHDLKFHKIVERMRKGRPFDLFKKDLFQILLKVKTYGMESIFDNESSKGTSELYLLRTVYTIYRIVLRTYETYDFDDLIIEATKKLDTIKIPYQYVIVDEFQDISKIRLKLLEKLISKNDADLIIVGDDWQSIYGFSGSDISEFYDVLKRDEMSIHYLMQVYRNSQELIDIMKNFILNEGNHISKTLVSEKHVHKPIQIYYYVSLTRKYCLIKILEKIIKDCCQSKVIYILGRFQQDEEILKQIKEVIQVEQHQYCYKQLQLKFFTIHSVKGLSADEVILVNLTVGEYGFPSDKKNRYFLKILPLLFKEDRLEERRLFYVALTRTRNCVYLMAPYFSPSPFVKEIKKWI